MVAKSERKLARGAAVMKRITPKRIRSMNYQEYATVPSRFQTWLDVIYSRIGLPIPAASALIGVVVLLSGLIISEIFDFGAKYLQTKAIYIGIFGISFVSGMIRYASLNIHEMFEHLRPCFWVDDAAYKSFLDRWFFNLSKSPGNLLAVAIYGLLAVLLALGEFLSPLENRQSPISFKAYIFERFWYTPENLWGKIILIAFYGICIAFPLGFATALLAKNYFFVRELGNLPVIPLPHLIRSRLRDVLDFYLHIVFSWSIGIGLFGLVFFTYLDAWSVVFLSTLNFFGLITFISPQLCYQKYLKQAKRTITQWALKDFYASLGIKLAERPTMLTHSIPPYQGFSIEQLRVRPLIYEWTDLIVLIVSQIIVYGTVFLGRLV